MTELLSNITQDLNLLPLQAPVVIAKIAVAFLCSFFIAFIYRKTYRGPGYSVAYTHTLILLSMTTAVVIMVIGNNLARAFGLVGAMSIVRFRHAVKNTQDIVYIFFALAVGMAAGVGFYTIAIVGTLFISLVIYLLARSRLGTPRRDDYLLQFSTRSAGDESPPWLAVLNRHCRKLTPINVRSLGDSELMELSYYVRLHDTARGDALIEELNRVPGVDGVNLFFDEEQI
ncbi:MAG TPA: DUF4956 domain-containing protein [candidate division WOR-3 bacterium]|uniref:DUF4956 domain-containing protein n=1 Tax=candidate division WOR-3 bacterium TaxID=2052148 RepID=A0A7V0XFV8_UNCW3|nr:DUF4956 domain-containing protein [candidate division WOR-3 bacterium]